MFDFFIKSKLKKIIMKTYKSNLDLLGENGKDEFGNNVDEKTFNDVGQILKNLNNPKIDFRSSMALATPSITGYVLDNNCDNYNIMSAYIFAYYSILGKKPSEKELDDFENEATKYLKKFGY